MSKKQQQATKVMRIRNTVLIFMVAAVILILGYGTFYSTAVNPGEFVEGEHYTVVEDAERRRPGAPIDVVEFFSYSCIHCKNFDPVLLEWQATLPEDVTFTRSPVAFNPLWSLLAQTYLTFDQLGILEQNHERMFRQIHDRQIQFLSADQIADFVDGNGVSKEEFLRAFNGSPVRRALGEADAAQREVGIASVPTLVVAGKYVVNMDHGRKVVLDIVDHLIEQERATDPANATSD